MVNKKCHFPKRLYTTDEVLIAKKLIEDGYRHRLEIEGDMRFRERIREALNLVRTANYYDFLRTYIKRIVFIDGLSPLREADATIWANEYVVIEPVEAASYLIQKSQQMKNYIEGKPYVGGLGEANAVKKRIEFLEALRVSSKNDVVRKKCEEILKLWNESKFL